MEKLKALVLSWWHLLRTVFVNVRYNFHGKNKAMPCILAIQRLVLGIILYPLAVLYMLGFYISAGISLWRLRERDFGDTGGPNQKPALQVLYTLAVVQGVLFCCKTMNGFVSRTRLAEVVAEVARVDKELVAKYLEETVAGCKKDPSFATGRNLVTYGVDLMMEAKSSKGFLDGIKVLGGVINDESGRKGLANDLLTRSDSSSASIHRRLLETVGPKSSHSREIKVHVVRILDIIAAHIRLEQFPRAIECLCSIVDTSEEYEKDYVEREHIFGYSDDCSFFRYLKWRLFQCLPCKRLLYGCLPCRLLIQHCLLGKRKTVENEIEENRRGFDQVLLIAANIIYKLVADEDNTWIMRTCVSNTVLRKIAMLPTKLHRENHYPCRVDQKSELQMLEQCWVLTERLLAALTLTVTRSLPLQPATPIGEGRPRSAEIIEEEVEEGEEQLPLDCSTIKRTIKDSTESTIKCIFDCLDCSATQKRQAIQVLLHLSLNVSSIVKDSESSKRRLSWILLLIFCSTDDDSKHWMVPSLTYRNKNCCDFNGIRRKAGEKLSEMLREKPELPSEESARELLLVGLALGDLKSAFDADSKDISIRTHAIIIMEGLCHLDYTSYSEVQEFLVNAIPKVVKETLILCGSITAERQEQATDVEKGKVSQDNQDGCIDAQRLRKALASLCYFGYIWNSNSTLRPKFKEIASKTCEEQGKSFWDFYSLIHQSIE